MNIKKIQDADLENKRVLLRVDFNVAVENGKVQEVFKIKAAKESLEYLLSKNCQVALISHLGRPEGKINPEFSLGQMKDELENMLGIHPVKSAVGGPAPLEFNGVKIKFVSDCIGEKVKSGLGELKSGEVMLLENVRFYSGEETNDTDFSQKLAENFDVFVNDAFSVCHRDQASVTGVAKILPSFAGLRLQKEIENLEKVSAKGGSASGGKDTLARPAVAIIGGAKIETKLPLIKKLEEIYDHILVGGKIANEAMDEKMQFSEKVILPTDLAKDRLDIGPKTIEEFKTKIIGAKTIVWNGPMGKFEEKPYDIGTEEIFQAVIASGAFTLMGGGESIQILEEHNAMDKISFVSTGGGAMLEYLSGNSLPGIDVLKD
ncbi:MAG: phosphoglycerate kinase [Candidatus Moranbacteria bacterium CG_4_9_14_3_um_filter_36_9]|nr:MAG: phosphoglycerate kinase [Candidatus Moranbacteria bacterium CG_4_9_14_3_um_filter_36_9]